VGDWGGGGSCPLPPKKSEKYFSGKYDVKFGHFVNLQANIMYNSGILLIFHTYFREIGKMSCPQS